MISNFWWSPPKPILAYVALCRIQVVAMAKASSKKIPETPMHAFPLPPRNNLPILHHFLLPSSLQQEKKERTNDSCTKILIFVALLCRIQHQERRKIHPTSARPCGWLV